MSKTGSLLKLAATLAVVLCVVGVSASAASAHTWAPLNTKFEGKNATGTVTAFKFLSKEGATLATWECSKDTFNGTTAISASESLSATPGFSFCSFSPGALTIFYKFQCKAGHLPWILTLGTGTKGNVTLNCPLVLEAPAIVGCAVTVLEQPSKEGLTWTDVGTKEGVQLKLAVKKISATATPSCELGEKLEAEFTGTFELPNVYVA